MKPSIIKSHFAPCSDEKVRYRLEEAERYETAKKDVVKFWDCKDAEEYRQLEREGKADFDAPVYDPDAESVVIKSRQWDGDEIHDITLRVLRPKNSKPKGIFMFIHGGGFVIGSALLHDNVLRDLAERTSLVMVSPEYCLAPQFKLPAGSRDCVDAAMYLLSPECEEKLGATLRFIGGESAGGYLTVQTTIMLRDLGVNVREKLAGILPMYAIADLSLLPSVRLARPTGTDSEIDESKNYIALAVPREVWTSNVQIKKPEWSPLYADMKNLPPACFSVGTEDSLIDDSVLLASRWELAGNESELIIYPGTPHGYVVVNLDVTKESLDDIVDFVERRIK